MSETANAIHGILKKAYQIEVDGYTFYSMAADKAEKPAVQELFDKLAHDETEHKAFIRQIIKNYDSEGSHAFALKRRAPELTSFTSTIFTKKFKEQAEGATFEMGVLSIGKQLESNAIAYFSQAAEKTSEEEVKSFYNFIADWEREHFEALDYLLKEIRSDFWSGSSFAPF